MHASGRSLAPPWQHTAALGCPPYDQSGRGVRTRRLVNWRTCCAAPHPSHGAVLDAAADEQEQSRRLNAPTSHTSSWRNGMEYSKRALTAELRAPTRRAETRLLRIDVQPSFFDFFFFGKVRVARLRALEPWRPPPTDAACAERRMRVVLSSRCASSVLTPVRSDQTVLIHVISHVFPLLRDGRPEYRY